MAKTVYGTNSVRPVVYRITCLPTGRVYVGSTRSFDARWRAHRADLEAGRHRNRFLQFAWRKYGAAAFECVVVEQLDAMAEMAEVERFWIGMLGAWAPAGFNLADPQDAAVQAAKNYVVTSPDGVETAVTNLHAFCRANGLNSASMLSVAQARAPVIRGWRCRYANESREAWQARVDAMMAGRDARCRLWRKGYVITDLDGVEHHVTEMGRWCRAHGLDHSAMSRVALGQATHHKGYKARRTDTTQVEWAARFDDAPAVRVTHPDGRVENVRCLKHFIEAHKLCMCSVYRVLRGESETHHGMRFERLRQYSSRLAVA